MSDKTKSNIMVAIFLIGIVSGLFRFDGLCIFCGLLIVSSEMTDCVNYYVKTTDKTPTTGS